MMAAVSSAFAFYFNKSRQQRITFAEEVDKEKDPANEAPVAKLNPFEIPKLLMEREA